MAMMQTVTSQPSLRTLLGLRSNGAVSGDAFAMIFAQMMGTDGGWEALLGQLRADLQEESGTRGAQLAAEMLTVFPGLQAQLMQQGDLPAVLGHGSGGGLSLAGLSALTGQPQPAASEGGEDTAVLPEDFYTLLKHAWQDEGASTPDGMLGESGLRQDAVRAAKQLLADSPQETVEAMDPESLQAETRTFSLEGLRDGRPAALPGVQTIASQLKTGILEQTGAGKNEFIVRLEPEGIGEIVVKLSEDHERIALSIFTSSTYTAKLITDEVVTLQNALRPLQAEVQQIVVTENEPAAQYAAQNELSYLGQQDQGQRYAGAWQQDGHAGQAAREQDDFETLLQPAPADGLDTYI